VTLADLEPIFARWLKLPDLEPLHVTLGAVAANLLDGDPLWVFLVAPPSSLKTELIRALGAIECVYPLSSLTPQTLASGFQTSGKKAREVSLILRLDGKVLTLKDFTSVLSMHHDARGAVLAQLREIYDGALKKEFGNGVVVDWSGKVGLIAGVTPVIDTYSSVGQILGERFLLYRLSAPDELEAADRAMSQNGQEPAMRQELRQAVGAFFAELVPLMVPIPEDIKARLGALAAFVARARSGVLWDDRGEIKYVPEPEGPGRLAKQFLTLARGLAVVRDTREVTAADYFSVYRVAEDTVPAQRRAMLTPLLGTFGAEHLETAVIAEEAGYPTVTARRYLHELAAMRLVDRTPGGQGRADRWRLSDLAARLLEKAAPPEREPQNLFRNGGGVGGRGDE
jgi:hypothetical protein